MKKSHLFIFILLFLLPQVARAEVIINEVAWMGTAHSASDEWIELANTGDQSVSLAGWKLHTADNSVNMSLTGSIPANGFYLLERTDDTTVPDITADKIYTGALSDSGEKLILENSSGVVQTIDAGTKWPAGNTTTNQTMQWSGGSWITAVGTPKAQNAGVGSSTDINTAQTSTMQTTAPKIIPHVAFSIPSPLYAGVQYDIGAEAVLEYMTPGYGYFVWNFGDGTYTTKDTNTEPLSHTYQYSGNYTISFAYYRNSYEKKPVLMDTKKVEVFVPTVVLSAIDNGRALMVKNTSDKVEDISGWHLDTDSGKTVFPPMTFIAAKSQVTFTAKVLDIDTTTGAKIYTPFEGFSTQIEKPIVVKSIRRNTAQNSTFKNVVAVNVVDTASVAIVPEETQKPMQTNSHTREILLGVAIVTVIGLFLLLERFIAKKE